VRAYYHARAAEYDDWWLGQGLFAERDRPGWDEELAELVEVLTALVPVRTLDVACGTGFLTRHLPGEIVALDQSEAMVEIARARVPHASIRVGDALALPFPDASFERLFTSFFYCHLEEADRVRFVGEARRVASELIVVGSVAQPGEQAERWDERVLDDGSRWRVYKRVFEPEALAHELGGEVIHAGRWFVAVRSR